MTEGKKTAFLSLDPYLNRCNCLFFSKWCLARTRESCSKKGTEWWLIILLLHICEIGDLPDFNFFKLASLLLYEISTCTWFLRSHRGIFFLRGSWARFILSSLLSLTDVFPALQVNSLVEYYRQLAQKEKAEREKKKLTKRRNYMHLSVSM